MHTTGPIRQQVLAVKGTTPGEAPHTPLPWRQDGRQARDCQSIEFDIGEPTWGYGNNLRAGLAYSYMKLVGFTEPMYPGLGKALGERGVGSRILIQLVAVWMGL